jgi:hypothetical protein
MLEGQSAMLPLQLADMPHGAVMHSAGLTTVALRELTAFSPARAAEHMQHHCSTIAEHMQHHC